MLRDLTAKLVELIGDAENYDYVEFTAKYAPSPCMTSTASAARSS